MLPGEERTYNDASLCQRNGDGTISLYEKEGGSWVMTICDDGQTIVEGTRPCFVRFNDGSLAAMSQALEEISEADRVREARAIARRTLREAGKR
jgi:hypothetical protein